MAKQKKRRIDKKTLDSDLKNIPKDKFIFQIPLTPSKYNNRKVKDGYIVYTLPKRLKYQ